MKNNTNKKPLKTLKSVSKKSLDKNQILAYILAVLIIFWTVASVFSFIAYSRTSRKSSNNNMIKASAETVDSFETYESLVVDLPHLTGLAYVSNLTVGVETVTIMPKLCIELEKNAIILEGGTGIKVLDDYNKGFTPFEVFFRSANALDTLSYGTKRFYCTKTSSVAMPLFRDWSLMSDIKISYLIGYLYNANTSSTHFYFDLKLDFVYESKSYPLHYRFTHDLGINLPSDNCQFYVAYTNALRTNSTYTSNNNDAFGFPIVDFLKYYNISSTLDPDALLSYDLGKSDGIKIGKEQGQKIGYSDGYQVGYENGYYEGNTDGYTEGHDIGYQEGLDASNEYSFTNLIGAVIDVPVRTFTSLFSFDILGVDLSVFFFSLLTLAIILAVVRTLL